jgi:acyl-CoA thioester hydrolase
MKGVLNKDQIAALGIAGGWTMGLPDFVRYGDLDTYNHVNNKVYHAWFENIRVLYVRSLGVAFEVGMEIKPVVRSASIMFNAPMFQDEEYITLCRISRLGRTSFTIDYAVWVGGEMRVTGDSVMVMVNADASAAVPVPDDLREIMITHDGAATT